MNELDDAILEFYAEVDDPEGQRVALPPTAVWFNISNIRNSTDKKQNTFSYRMNKLSKRGLLEKYDEERGYYTITGKGRQYLTGELDADDLQIEGED